MAVLDSNSPIVFEKNPSGLGSGHDLQIRPVRHRVEIGPRGGKTTSLVDISVESGKTFLTVAIHVLGKEICLLYTSDAADE